MASLGRSAQGTTPQKSDQALSYTQESFAVQAPVMPVVPPCALLPSHAAALAVNTVAPYCLKTVLLADIAHRAS